MSFLANVLLITKKKNFLLITNYITFCRHLAYLISKNHAVSFAKIISYAYEQSHKYLSLLVCYRYVSTCAYAHWLDYHNCRHCPWILKIKILFVLFPLERNFHCVVWAIWRDRDRIKISCEFDVPCCYVWKNNWAYQLKLETNNSFTMH